MSVPQQRHVRQIADGLITVEGDKNLSNLYRHFVDDPCPKSAADTFREAPWQANDIRNPLRKYMVKTAIELAEAQGTDKQIFLSIDDSFTEKDRYSKCLEAVDWLYDRQRSSPKQPVYSKGTVYVLMRLMIGNISFTVDIQLYLPYVTIRKLNRKRKRGKKLSFRSKMTIAKESSGDCASLTKNYQVYVLFDSWYASAKFIKWCCKQKWQVIWIKSNRQLDRMPVKQHNKRLKHRRYKTVSVHAANDEQPKTYQVRSLIGRLNDVPQPIRILISKRHTGDNHPRYYGSTNTNLSLEKTLTFFGKRWSCEVANWYITEKLG